MITIKEFYEQDCSGFCYIAYDNKSREAVVIDSIANYNYYKGKISYDFADKIINFINNEKLELKYILETHIHADHISAACYFKDKFPKSKIAVSKGAQEVAKYWLNFFELNENINNLGFDIFLEDKQNLNIGNKNIQAIYTKGHTQSCISYIIEDNIFVGDLIFMPDVGTARADFIGASAAQIYDSVHKIFEFDDNFKIFSAHDYPQNNRNLRHFCTILEQKEKNILINAKISKEEFVKLRSYKDKNLPLPKMLYPSIQTNILAGRIPKTESGKKFIKIPAF